MYGMLDEEFMLDLYRDRSRELRAAAAADRLARSARTRHGARGRSWLQRRHGGDGLGAGR